MLSFLSNGLSYAFPAVPGPIIRGVATAHSAPILKDLFSFNEVYVWGSPNGEAKGQMISPLYPHQVKAIQEDVSLYHMLA